MLSKGETSLCRSVLYYATQQNDQRMQCIIDHCSRITRASIVCADHIVPLSFFLSFFLVSLVFLCTVESILSK